MEEEVGRDRGGWMEAEVGDEQRERGWMEGKMGRGGREGRWGMGGGRWGGRGSWRRGGRQKTTSKCEL